jgi:hypothetical protein
LRQDPFFYPPDKCPEMGNAECQELIKVLKTEPNITAVFLDDHPIDDEGIRGISECEGVKYLSLMGTKITEKSADELTKIKNLDALSISYTPLNTEQGINKILQNAQESLKHVSISHIENVKFKVPQGVVLSVSDGRTIWEYQNE